MKKQYSATKDLIKSNKIISIVLLILLLASFVELYHVYKPLPEGTSIESPIYAVQEKDISFLYDLTYHSSNGSKIVSQEIFDSILALVNSSNSFLVFDMFLFNAGYSVNSEQRNITRELTSALISKKQDSPNTFIHFTTDPLNTLYGSYPIKEHEDLKNANISFAYTNIPALRDSSPLFSMFWRTYLQWFGVAGPEIVPNPIGGDKPISPFALATLLNTKANHRKLFVSDASSGEARLLLTSANPHEASSKHSNIAFIVNSSALSKVALDSERGIASLSNVNIPDLLPSVQDASSSSPINLQFVSEGGILRSMLKDIRETSSGDKIELAMFYLSERTIIDELVQASERGVQVSLILDPNKDAFAREKNGIPNRPVANELVKRSKEKISIRWYDTKGEQFHTKMLIITKADGTMIVYGGSANLTKRNIGDLNLEADLRISAPQDSALAKEISSYFQRLWTNEDANFTLDFESYKDTSTTKYLIYRFQEFTGLSSF